MIASARLVPWLSRAGGKLSQPLEVKLRCIGPAGGLTLAHLLATGEPHPLMAPFTLKRFRHLDYVIESGTTTAR